MMIGIWACSGSGTSSTSGASRTSSTTRWPLYDGIRSTRHCGRQSLSQQQTRSVGRYSSTSRLMKSISPRTALTLVPSGRGDLGHAVERAEVHRGGVEEHQPVVLAGMRRAVERPVERSAGRPATGSAYAVTVNASDVEEKDRQILQLLARDGRMSYTDLGKATGLSTSAVHQRVKRLEQRGLILGYGATVNHAEIGLPLTAFISIRPIDPSAARRLTRAAAGHPRDRVLLVGRGGGVLHPQDPGGHARRPRGPAGPGPCRRQRVHPHHDRAVHAVREPPVGVPDGGHRSQVGPLPRRPLSTPAGPSARRLGDLGRLQRALVEVGVGGPPGPGRRRAGCGSGRSTRRCG